MAVMAPEAFDAAGAAAGATVGGAQKLGGEEKGSPVMFLLAIVLVGSAMIALYFAFHSPSEWDLSDGQYPGLVGRIGQWMQTAAEQSGPLGPLNTSQPAATSEAGSILSVLEGVGETASGVGPIEALATKGPSGVEAYFTNLGKSVVKALHL